MMQSEKKKLIGIVGVFLFVVGGGTIGYVLFSNSSPNYSLEEINQIDLNGETMVIHVVNSVAYIIDPAPGVNGRGLLLYDVSDPDAPFFLGSYTSDKLQLQISVQDDLVYIANLNGGLDIINCSDPANIVQVGTYRPTGTVYSVQIQDDLAFLGSLYDGFEIVNISDPSNPTLISQTLLSGGCIHLELDGNTCYVTHHQEDGTKIEIYDVENVHHPEKIGEISQTDVTFWDPIIYGDYLFAADHGDSGDLFIFDISDPSNAIQLVQFDTEGFVNDIWVDGTGEILYLADNEKGVIILDISDISAPEIIAQHFDGGRAADIQEHNGIIYVADQSDGVELLILNS